jgi:hypothetical protein
MMLRSCGGIRHGCRGETGSHEAGAWCSHGEQEQAGRSGREAYFVGTLHLAAEDAAVGGVDAQRLADELGEVGGGLAVVHGGAVVRRGARSEAARQQSSRRSRRRREGGRAT